MHINFIGRKQELKQLNDLWQRSKASLVVLKGRRRIGKSYLIEHFGKQAESFIKIQGLAPREHLGSKDQLKNFAEQLSIQTSTKELYFDNWNQAFLELSESINKNKKTVVLLDEISWLSAFEPDLPGKLKIAWDLYFSKYPKLILIICGSISSWIQENILNSTDFVGRISLMLKIEELSISESSQFWGTSSKIAAYEKFKLLNIIGGVPRYLDEIIPKKTAEENIGRMFLSKSGPLFNEFESIFNDIFSKRAKFYKEIVKILVNGKQSFAEICAKLGKQKNGVIAKYLEDLCESGFLARDYAYDPAKNGKKNKESYFRIKDNYLRFYLYYIEPYKAKIETGLTIFPKIEDRKDYFQIMGFQFENLVLSNLNLIVNALEIDARDIVAISPYKQVQNTKNKGACQIDLLIQTQNHVLYVCEIKYRKCIETRVIKEVERKIAVLKRPKYFSVRPVLIYLGEIINKEKFDDYFFKLLCMEDEII